MLPVQDRVSFHLPKRSILVRHIDSGLVLWMRWSRADPGICRAETGGCVCTESCRFSSGEEPLSDRGFTTGDGPTARHVLPHGAQTWYFKMTGPTAAVAKQVQKFRALIESVTFDDAGKPAWKLPEGWDEKPGSGQRVATIVANSDGQSLELSVIPMPTGGSAESLLDNINRWRRQMGQAPLQSTQLSAETQQLQLGDTSATLVDFEGRLQKTMGSQGSLAEPAGGWARARRPEIQATRWLVRSQAGRCQPRGIWCP